MLNYCGKNLKVVVFFISFLVYSPFLLNQFVGDDGIFLGGNTFYSSWHNVPRLFQKSYIANPQQINYTNDFPADFGSGSFSYRPVGSLTYFFDYQFFLHRPWASHLVNILIHSLNSVLVFVIVSGIFTPAIGLFAALLFCLHPIQSEVVANVSCRFDLLAMLFSLLCFYGWMRFRQRGQRKFYVFSLIMCFLALFSKESAVALPLVILFYDLTLVPRSQRADLTPIFGILFFYLYLYFMVFPPDAVSFNFHWSLTAFFDRALLMGSLWFSYLVNILLPWTVKVIPGLYTPPLPAMRSLLTEIILALMAVGIGVWLSWRHDRKISFFLLWYILFYFPVSNVFLLANPMACRFMYLPSVGLLTALACLLYRLFQKTSLKYLLSSVVILACLTRTVFGYNDWRDDTHVQIAWVRDYPDFGRGYAMLAIGYFNQGSLVKAKSFLELALSLGDQIPRDEFTLALCYMHLKQFKQAQSLLQKIIYQYPDYSEAYFCLGEDYYEQKDDHKAQFYFSKALHMNPRKVFGYVMLMKVYTHLDQRAAAQELFQEADKNLSHAQAAEFRYILEQTKATI